MRICLVSCLAWARFFIRFSLSSVIFFVSYLASSPKDLGVYTDILFSGFEGSLDLVPGFSYGFLDLRFGVLPIGS